MTAEVCVWCLTYSCQLTALPTVDSWVLLIGSESTSDCRHLMPYLRLSADFCWLGRNRPATADVCVWCLTYGCQLTFVNWVGIDQRLQTFVFDALPTVVSWLLLIGSESTSDCRSLCLMSSLQLSADFCWLGQNRPVTADIWCLTYSCQLTFVNWVGIDQWLQKFVFDALPTVDSWPLLIGLESTSDCRHLMPYLRLSADFCW